jgi:NitT/TauT family transport system substrate-binding protein
MKHRRIRLVGLLLTIGALLASGCGDSDDGAATTTTADSAATTVATTTTVAAEDEAEAEEPIEPVRVRMGVAAPISEFMLPWLGIELGIFEKHGIDLEVEMIPGGTQIIAGMVGGSLEAGIFAGPSVQNAIVQGAEMQWVMEWVHTPNLIMVTNESIESVEDLRGKPLAISAPGTTTAIFTDKVLREAGLDPARDVVQVTVGGQGEALAAFSSNQVVGAIFGAPVTFTALKTEGSKALVDYTEGYLWPYSGLSLTDSFLEAEPEAALRLVEAFLETIEVFKANPEVAMAVISRETNTPDMDLVKLGYDQAVAVMDDDAVPLRETAQAVLDELSFTQPAAEGFDVSKLYNDTLVKQALAKR